MQRMVLAVFTRFADIPGILREIRKAAFLPSPELVRSEPLDASIDNLFQDNRLGRSGKRIQSN